MKGLEPFLYLPGLGCLIVTHWESKMTTVDELYLFYLSVQCICVHEAPSFISWGPSSRSSNLSFKIIIFPSKPSQLPMGTTLVIALLLTLQKISPISSPSVRLPCTDGLRGKVPGQVGLQCRHRGVCSTVPRAV